MKSIIGRKVGMTSIFTEDGQHTPVTVIQAGPCFVVQRKTVQKDGYSAVQLGYLPIRERKANKPMRGHFKKAGLPPMKFLCEFRIPDEINVEVGEEITVSSFKPGDIVKVTGTSKGRGFAGVMKRWGMSGQRDSHGSRYHRQPASLGPQGPQRVFKGHRMPGRYGGKTVTIRGLKVVGVDSENHLLLLKGSVPGWKGSIVKIQADKP
ncbi:MAG: 50S ribosomal protein L3 [Armatimonadota bacterium]|nr:50S ribosomal protein L3 [Armatimonadota bacterium]MCX7776933.1 50S ribosomal protein L3 [Armatimonadota bacterium]MDW8024766.1 50S ribosomal protein L3 [Armatimonadota bacterium]